MRATNAAGTDDQLDEILDFLDDTGVVDKPSERIGHVLYDEHEAAAVKQFTARLDDALDRLKPVAWQAVGVAAGELRQVLTARPDGG